MAKTNHKTRHKSLLTYVMFFVAFAAPASNFPQIYTLFTLKVTEGLSVETWVMYIAFAFVQLAYAITNKIKPLIISNILWIAVECVMIYGILSFRIAKAPPEYAQLLLINNIGKAIGGLGIMCFSSAAALYLYDLMRLQYKLQGSRA